VSDKTTQIIKVPNLLRAKIGNKPDPDAIATIRKTSHEIKGQGQTLGYPLLTQAGHMLHGFIERDEACATRNLDLIAAHIDFMDLIVQKEIRGDGGPEEEMLLGALDQAARKLSKS
jgi:chemotaxis protein histidine kinase CheA